MCVETRKEGRRDLVNIDNYVDATIYGLEECTKYNKDNNNNKKPLDQQANLEKLEVREENNCIDTPSDKLRILYM